MHLRNLPPPPETFDHVGFLVAMAKWIKPQCYLELGVRDGTSLWPISEHCKVAFGVDLNLSSIRFESKSNITLVEKTTDDFFKELATDVQFDMVFIDANHTHTASLKDFTNVVPHVITDGFIFLHDTYPCSEELLQPQFCSDSYKTPLYLKKHFIDDFEILTLPFNPGLTLVKKMKRNQQLIFRSEIT